MRVCDICSSKSVNYDSRATVDDDGKTKDLELCWYCYNELRKRQQQHQCLAYIETVKARNGEIPRKSHWWDIFTW